MHAHEALFASTTGSGRAPEVIETDLPALSVSLDGRLVDANDALCRLIGLRRRDLLGRDLRSLGGYPTDTQRGQRALAAARAGTPCGSFTQLWTLAADRPSVRVRLVWTLIWDAQGDPDSLMVFCLDESEQAATARFWEALLAESDDITWTADERGLLRAVTPGAVRQLGRSRAELVGTPVLDLAHPDDREVLREAWGRVIGGGTREVLEYRLVHAERGWTPVRQVLTDHRGDPDVHAIVGNAVDLHDLREAERTGSLATARMRAQFDRSPVPQVEWDTEGRLTEANAAFCRLVGRPADELVGRPASDLLHRSDPGDAASGHGLLTDEDGALSERVLTRPDDGPLPTLVSGTVLRDRAGDPAGVTASVQDLSGLRRLEARREQQESFFLAQRAGELALVTDAEGLVLYTSPALAALVGWSAEDLVELGTDQVHADELPAAAAAFGRVLREGTAETVMLRARDAAGGWRWMEATGRNLLDTAVGGVVWNLRDIDDRVRAEAALRASESRYRAIADNADEGLWVVAPDGRTVYTNHRLVEILGLEDDEVHEHSLLGLLDPTGQLRQRREASPERRSERYEVGYHHPDGRRRTLLVSAAPLDDDGGTVEGSLAMVSDVTDARRLEDELRRAALHDTLTGLPNRALLFDRLKHALMRETSSTAVLFLDLDQFKNLNDMWGHVVGDELLVRVAARLQAAVRPTDTVARFAGDEFLVVCEDVDENAALLLAQDLLTALDTPFEVVEGEVRLTASIGVSTSPATSAEELLRHADAAMYAAKAAGRNRVRVFDAGLAADTEHHRLGGDLRRALERDELTLHHQPVVDLSTGRVVGTEALARWTHPVHGVITPDRFVSVAEHVGLAPQLDRWALSRALSDARALRAEGAMATDAYVGVNVSAYTLCDPGLDAWITRTVRAAGFAPEQVLLEVTESAIMSDAPTAVGVLTRLRERGFAVAVDDFGTGHSSLAYLRNLPLTMLKIDRSFVAELASDPSALAIAASIVELARAVGLTVVAEGVETPEHAELLRSLGCDAAQGWLWSRAVSPEEARTSGALAGGYQPPRAAVDAP